MKIDQIPVPVELDAERAVLAVAMRSTTGVADARRMLCVDDFYGNRHAAMFGACCDLADAGVEVEPVALLAELKRRGVGDDQLAPWLFDLYQLPVAAVNVDHYATQVRAASRRRKLARVATRLAEITVDTPDLDAAMTKAAREALELSLLLDEQVDGPVDGLTTWREFLSQPDRVEDWIVPGLIERQDVVMILAAPGAGKSWLSRQMCRTVAAGIHPFKPRTRIEPQRTLLVDLENPPTMVRRQSHALDAQVTHLGGTPGGGFVWMRPEGLNLRQRADAQLLERVIAETQPALVALGSLYKAFQRGRDDWDTAAEETRAVFDRLRARYRCAFWLEHHMPKGAENKNPFGSSVWERWPGFGRVIERKGPNAFALSKTFRGDRDEREFPAGLYRGGALPWSPIWTDDELEMSK